jgi:pimeloyl-ACP methyl ester carboxylesterase
LAADLAKSGFVIYVMDARGYGNSTRPEAMDRPPEETRPLSRAYEVTRDIDAVVSEAQRRNKSAWRDPAVAQAYQDAALASDPTSVSRNPASLRAPNGGLEDSFYQAIGRPLYDGSSIVGRVLIVRSGNDFWSRPEDAETLASHLDNAKQVSVLTLPNATHFVHLDRPERGRTALIDAVLTFLAQ